MSFRNINKRNIWGFWAGILLAICGGCQPNPVPEQAPKQTPDTLKLGMLLAPSDEWAMADLTLTALHADEIPLEIPALGTVVADPRQLGLIAARVPGRIERLYLRYVFQPVKKGQKVLDLYSPELVTAQENLLFLIKNDPNNSNMIESARQRLQLLGFSDKEMTQIEKTEKPLMTMSVLSPYTGYIRNPSEMQKEQRPNMPGSSDRENLNLREGNYVEAGTSIFEVWDHGQVWIQLQIGPPYQSIIKTGKPVRIVPESAPSRDFRAHIDYLEPFYNETSKTLVARVYFNNTAQQLPLGSQVSATLFRHKIKGHWLPATAVLSLGLEDIAFVRSGQGMAAVALQTGLRVNDQVQILSGLSPTDSVALNAQFLMDSESFIKISAK